MQRTKPSRRVTQNVCLASLDRLVVVASLEEATRPTDSRQLPAALGQAAHPPTSASLLIHREQSLHEVHFVYSRADSRHAIGQRSRSTHDDGDDDDVADARWQASRR